MGPRSRAESRAQEVDADPVTSGAHAEPATEQDGAIGAVDGLVEEPAASRRGAAPPDLDHDRPAHRLIGPAEVELLHASRALAERGPTGAEIHGEDRVVV